MCCWGAVWGDLQPRHINHMTMEAFHAEYLLWAEGSSLPLAEQASCRTFRDVYDAGWRKILCMRKISQHSRLLGKYFTFKVPTKKIGSYYPGAHKIKIQSSSKLSVINQGVTNVRSSRRESEAALMLSALSWRWRNGFTLTM